MPTDFSKGRYIVRTARGYSTDVVGRIDEDEFVRDPHNKLLYRIDDDMVFDMQGGAVGIIQASGPGRWLVSSRDPSGITAHLSIQEE